MEFGARSSGEPAGAREVRCDADPYLDEVSFPAATPRVMAVERTFWEKATAAHVYCLQQRLRSGRFARHWYDLAQLERTGFADGALRSREIASQVADHKQRFFRENSSTGEPISYRAAVEGKLVLVPTGEARARLVDEYDRMLSSGLLPMGAASFDDVLKVCRSIQKRANAKV